MEKMDKIKIEINVEKCVGESEMVVVLAETQRFLRDYMIRKDYRLREDERKALVSLSTYLTKMALADSAKEKFDEAKKRII